VIAEQTPAQCTEITRHEAAEDRWCEAAMSAFQKSARKAAPPHRQRRTAMAPPNATTACDTAFRVAGRRCLGDLTANHAATCRGDPEALHQMRMALTRLRSAISFFSPMVADARRAQIRGELKWLNADLGAVRDLDVAIERFKATGKQRPPPLLGSWKAERAARHRQLARALRSARYRRLVHDTSNWIEHGPWSVAKGKPAARDRACPVGAYSAAKLARWQKKLLKKCPKLPRMSVKKRHRLRLINKKLCYATEFFGDLFPGKRLSRQRVALKVLRQAQKSLGQLNDDAKGRSLATAKEREGGRAAPRRRGRERRLIRTAAAAYRKLAGLKPIHPLT
jgi:CHAD domain-containing protein